MYIYIYNIHLCTIFRVNDIFEGYIYIYTYIYINIHEKYHSFVNWTKIILRVLLL